MDIFALREPKVSAQSTHPARSDPTVGVGGEGDNVRPDRIKIKKRRHRAKPVQSDFGANAAQLSLIRVKLGLFQINKIYPEIRLANGSRGS